MNEMSRAAFLIAQAAMLQAELVAMQAANTERESKGYSLAYGEDAFCELQERYSCLTHNGALSWLREA
jgi:hypothetical protein